MSRVISSRDKTQTSVIDGTSPWQSSSKEAGHDKTKQSFNKEDLVLVPQEYPTSLKADSVLFVHAIL
jgi:hypothetical protein